MADKKGLEMQLLESWNSWDEIDCCVLYFYDVVPKEHVKEVLGDFVAKNMTLDCQKSVVDFYDEEENVKTFKVSLSLVV